MKEILTGVLLILLAVPSGAETVPPGGAMPLGQVLSENLRVDGLYTPPGTTLLAGSRVRSHRHPGMIHLRAGEVVWLDRQSSAPFERTAAGETRMTVHPGQLTVRGPESEPLTLAEQDTIVLASLGSAPAMDSETGEVRAGAEVGPPAIEDAQVACVPGAPYPVLEAAISPAAAVDSATVFFRAGQFFNFYTVEMRRVGVRFQAVLPQPHPDTREVVYYVEVAGLSGESARTQEYVAEVVSEGECERQGGAGRYLGGTPPEAFYSTATGGAAEPPGFLFEDEPAAAVASGGKKGWFGGLSKGTKIGLAAGGAVGLGFLITELDDSDEAPASLVTP